MTTISYHHKDKQIAVDSRNTCGGCIICDDYDKTIIQDGKIWLFTGRAGDMKSFAKNYYQRGKAPENIDVCGILVENGKVFHVVVNNGIYRASPVTFSDAWGSGCDYAIASMDFGKSAKEAIEYAMTRDIYTGGKVQVIDVETGNVI